MPDSRSDSSSRPSRQNSRGTQSTRRSSRPSRSSSSHGGGTRAASSRNASGRSTRSGGRNAPLSSPTRAPRARAEGGGLNTGRGGGGYSLRQHNIRFNNKGGGFRDRLERLDRRTILVLVAALVAIIILVLVVSSCVNSCSSEQVDETPVNEQDSRVAYGVDSQTTSTLTSELDLAEKYEKLAKQADEYDDSRLIDLAIAEPDSIDFVLSYPDLVSDDSSDTQTSGEGLDGTIEAGSLQQLWCWDSRWGAIEYDDGPLAVTGSGPYALSVAIMYVSGDTTMTPGQVAALASSAGADTGDSGMNATFITEHAEDLGIDAQFYTPSSDNLAALLAGGTPVLIDTRSDATDLGDSPHWLVVLSQNDDASITVFDPTSTANSSHTWAIGTIVANANSLYSIAASTTAATTQTVANE